jgi:hypothetical protein
VAGTEKPISCMPGVDQCWPNNMVEIAAAGLHTSSPHSMQGVERRACKREVGREFQRELEAARAGRWTEMDGWMEGGRE